MLRGVGSSSAMRRKPSPDQQTPEPHKPTPTFLLEVPLHVTASQARRLRAHLEAARQLYNAILSEGQRRVRRMRADPAWQRARAIPRTRDAGTKACLWRAPRALWVFRVRAARRREGLELCLDR